LNIGAKKLTMGVNAIDIIIALQATRLKDYPLAGTAMLPTLREVELSQNPE
jgi:hypothetical protein